MNQYMPGGGRSTEARVWAGAAGHSPRDGGWDGLSDGNTRAGPPHAGTPKQAPAGSSPEGGGRG